MGLLISPSPIAGRYRRTCEVTTKEPNLMTSFVSGISVMRDVIAAVTSSNPVNSGRRRRRRRQVQQTGHTALVVVAAAMRECFRSDRNGRFLACFDASGASTLWVRRSRPLFPVSHAPPPRGGLLHTHSRLQHRGDASWGLSDGRTTALPTAISSGKGNDYSSCLLVYKSSTLSVPLNPHRQPSFVSKFCRCCGSQVDLFNQLCPSNNKLGSS
jgi:hypothetical protein